MPITLRLKCLIEGEDIAFPVTAACDDEVSDLKKSIQKERVLDSLKGVGPHTLELWKPKDSNSIAAEPEDTLVERIGLLGHDFSSFADKLGSSRTVFSIFPTQPPRDYIHIIVKVPHTSGLVPSPSAITSWKTLSARKLGPNEAGLFSEIAFKLYDSLWTKQGTWSDITETVEECIPTLNPYDDNDELYDDVNDSSAPSPDVSMREPKTPTKACFVNLTHMLNWSEVAEAPLEPYFLVREEYYELYEYLDKSDFSKHVLLLGHPGIGKTIFLTFCLLRRLISRRPTIFATSPQSRFIFLATGVYSIPQNFYDSQDPILVQRYKDSLVLQDLNELQPNIQSFGAWRMLVSTSPEPHRYKEWQKHKQPNTFVMKTWTSDEIFLARAMGVGPRTDDQWRTAYLKYGGSAGLYIS